MLYKNVKVEQISISIYMGKKYAENNFRKNQDIFKKKVSKQNAICGFGYECPIEDLICIYPDGLCELEETISKSDFDKVISVYDEMSKIFEDVKINLYLEDFLEDGNSVDLSKEEFINCVS